MVANTPRCDRARLRLLLEDRLPGTGQTELERHLETCVECRRALESQAADPAWWDEARQFLGTGAASADAGTSERRTESGPEDECDEGLPLGLLLPSDNPGMLGRLGHYEIAEVIGRGGMGIVLKGFDPALNRFVAIKVLAPHLAASGAARQRFAREARAAAAVVHEHVVAIHSIETRSPLPYLVMPWIAGESLQQRIDRTGPLELKEILRIGAQVAEGLAAAHAQGLVHRDIKPANILLENGVERVKITDFGLARAIDDATVTHSGFLAGTPQYMAPEQARGEAIDHRCDLFSLGSVLYAMCAGHSPFRAETTMAVLRRVCDENPTPIRQVNADMPEWLAEIIEKLHAKYPAERFQSASEVADLLSRHLAHCQQPQTVPMPPPLGYHSPGTRAVRRRRRWIAAAASFTLAAIVGIAGLTHWAARERAVRGSPDPAPAMTAGLPHREERRPSVGVSAGSETRAERKAGSETRAQRERDMRAEQLLRAELDRIEDPELDWDPLPAEIDGVNRELRRIEARWQGASQFESESPSVVESLQQMQTRLDGLEMQWKADDL